jgi:hypothetical protein
VKCLKRITSTPSSPELNGFIAMILGILNSTTKRRARNTRITVDCTDISVDINYSRKPVKQVDLEGKDYGISAKGMFIGMKLTGFRISLSQASALFASFSKCS